MTAIIVYASTEDTRVENLDDFKSQFNQEIYNITYTLQPAAFAEALKSCTTSKVILVSDEPSVLKAVHVSDRLVRTVLVTNGVNRPLDFKPSKVLLQLQMLPTLLDCPDEDPLLFDSPEPEFRVLFLYELARGKLGGWRQVEMLKHPSFVQFIVNLK